MQPILCYANIWRCAMLTIKFAIFLALEVFVVAVVASLLLAGLYAVVRDAVQSDGLRCGLLGR